jgi:hypothetical protein
LKASVRHLIFKTRVVLMLLIATPAANASVQVPTPLDGAAAGAPARPQGTEAPVLPDRAADPPTLPAGSETHWVVQQPEELVTYVLFDPATVADRLPPALRFITVGEVAARGLQWAAEHLAGEPAHKTWGISFVEIVRSEVFDIDGRSPQWPEHGAAALWAARVAPSDPGADLGPGVPFLLLDFWMPDSLFVTYMRDKGYQAAYGNPRLSRDPGGEWSGSLDAGGLKVVVRCTPAGPVSGGESSRGMQVFFPPRPSGLTNVTRVALAGHRIQECPGESSWTLKGPHPLARGIVLGSTTFQFGYHLVGGVYHR